MEEINALPLAEQPQNLGHEIVPPPPFNMEAVSAQLRYSVALPNLCAFFNTTRQCASVYCAHGVLSLPQFPSL